MQVIGELLEVIEIFAVSILHHAERIVTDIALNPGMDEQVKGIGQRAGNLHVRGNVFKAAAIFLLILERVECNEIHDPRPAIYGEPGHFGEVRQNGLGKDAIEPEWDAYFPEVIQRGHLPFVAVGHTGDGIIGLAKAIDTDEHVADARISQSLALFLPGKNDRVSDKGRH